MEIIVERRPDDFMAYLAGHRDLGRWLLRDKFEEQTSSRVDKTRKREYNNTVLVENI